MIDSIGAVAIAGAFAGALILLAGVVSTTTGADSILSRYEELLGSARAERARAARAAEQDAATPPGESNP